MGWILIWATMSGSGVVTTGSAHFATMDACFAGQQAYSGVVQELTKDSRSITRNETLCVSEQTGERRSVLKPQL